MEKLGGFYRPDHGRNLRLRLRLGQLPVVHRRNAGLAYPESKRRAELNTRRDGSTKSKTRSRGARDRRKRKEKYPLLR